MENASIILKQIVIMFIYMSVGYALFHMKLITKEGSKSLANLLLYVVLPCVLVKSFCLERTPERVKWLLISIAGAAVLLVTAMWISHLVFRKHPVDDFGAAFSNAGFIGFPLITAVLGEQAVFYAAGFVALINALQWTYGQSLMSGDPSMRSIKAVLKNPLVISVGIGLLVFFCNIPLPPIVTAPMGAFAALNAPLAMVILGVYLAQTDIVSMFTEPRLYLAAAVRLVLIPLVSVCLMKILLRGYPDIRLALLLSACAPIGSNVAVYEQKLGKNYTHAVKIVCLSTFLSVITMPLLMMII